MPSPLFEEFAHIVNKEAASLGLADRVSPAMVAKTTVRALNERSTARPNLMEEFESAARANLTEARASRTAADPVRERAVQRRLAEALPVGHRMKGRPLTLVEEVDLELTLLEQIPATKPLHGLSESELLRTLSESEMGSRPNLAARSTAPTESPYPAAREFATLTTEEFRRELSNTEDMIRFGGRSI
jgi:hypothetical protein